jgi:signal transduction histidine kinase
LLKSNQDSLSFASAERERLLLENDKILIENKFNLQTIDLINNERQLQELQIQKGQSDFLAQKAETEKSQNALALVNKESEIKNLEIKKQRLVKNIFIGGFILLGLISFLVYKYFHTRQQLKLQALRNKISSDLHDDVGSTLSSIYIFSEMARQQSKEVIPMLDTIGESSKKMLDAMADIVWTINPENDDLEKILDRMRSFAYELLRAKNIDFQFEADEDLHQMKLPMDVRKNLYLIFKEATNNMVKYADADKAYFAIKEENKNLTMIVSDNGKGFDVNKSFSGNGLKSMQKRAKEIGGALRIESHPQVGTRLELKIAV